MKPTPQKSREDCPVHQAANECVFFFSSFFPSEARYADTTVRLLGVSRRWEVRGKRGGGVRLIVALNSVPKRGESWVAPLYLSSRWADKRQAHTARVLVEREKAGDGGRDGRLRKECVAGLFVRNIQARDRTACDMTVTTRFLRCDDLRRQQTVWLQGTLWKRCSLRWEALLSVSACGLDLDFGFVWCLAVYVLVLPKGADFFSSSCFGSGSGAPLHHF